MVTLITGCFSHPPPSCTEDCVGSLPSLVWFPGLVLSDRIPPAPLLRPATVFSGPPCSGRLSTLRAASPLLALRSHVTTRVPMLCPFSRRPPFLASTCLNVSRTHIPQHSPFTACPNPSKPSLNEQAISDLPALPASSLPAVCPVSPRHHHTASSSPAASRAHCRRPKGRDRAASAEPGPARSNPPRGRRSRWALSHRLKSLQRTKFGGLMAKADRLTDDLSAPAWQLRKSLHLGMSQGEDGRRRGKGVTSSSLSTR